jgi:ABC-type lipoprotein release transport system permease subunit
MEQTPTSALTRSGSHRTMILSEVVAISASSLWAHKLRSVLTLIGGVIGVLFGSGLSLLLRYGLKMPAVLSLFWILTALILCTLIGIVFGVYPAWKAARLDPVEALRYE